ncbi:MAG: hypothetical protein FWG83_07895 [Oscillospiraceae bacterium]|nr:hypothetical protein [Oscillospiraceae bacterium]
MSVVLFVIMLLTTVFLVVMGVMFSGKGNAAPELFGSNVFLVRSDAFEILPPAPCAVIGKKVQPTDLNVGVLVIYETEDGFKSVGEVAHRETLETDEILETDETLETDGSSLNFVIINEVGEHVDVYETRIIAKVTQTSRTLGILINFAISPIGVLVIAVIPCLCVIGWELFKPLFRKSLDKKNSVEPVNKQDETPTFVPIEIVAAPEEDELHDKPEKKTSETAVFKEFKESREQSKAQANPAAALRAYKQIQTSAEEMEKSLPQSPQLFVKSKPGENLVPVKPHETFIPFESAKIAHPPKIEDNKPAIQPKLVEKRPVQTAGNQPASTKKKPLSSVKLAEVIAEYSKLSEKPKEGE